jgi:hypothetical protein
MADFGRIPYNLELLKSVANARVIIPKRAEVIFSPDKMFKDKDLSLERKVDDFI